MADKTAATPAGRFLRRAGISFQSHPYAYQDHGGTATAARELGLDEHQVIKTLVMEDERRQPFLVLMHGDREVSTRRLARTLGVKKVTPCPPATAEKHTGYQVGGISPFGTRKSLPVYHERSLTAVPRVYINGGRRGLLFSLDPAVLVELLASTPVDVAR
ncbi:MAG: aminoacyl-tRNA deacylase [Deltaproteobacteria bacterium]|nr:aminoacyl-tRNA deacylase [Deltaproteobacteria bacterium]